MKTLLGNLAGLLLILISCQPTTEQANNADKLFTLLPPDFTGVHFKNPIRESEKENHLVNDMLISGAGVAVGDINNDGLPDLFFTCNQVQDRLYLNKGNLKFEDITDQAGILPDNIWSSGVTFGDINISLTRWMILEVCKLGYPLNFRYQLGNWTSGKRSIIILGELIPIPTELIDSNCNSLICY